MKTKYLLIIISIGILLFVQCTKKNETIPTKTELLTAKNWMLSAANVAPAVVVQMSGFPIPISDLYSYLPACLEDNFTKFASNNTYVTDENTSKCNPTDPQTSTGNWNFNSDESKITLSNYNNSSKPTTFDVAEISADKLGFSLTINDKNDLANIIDTTGISASLNNVTIKPGTKLTINFKPKP